MKRNKLIDPKFIYSDYVKHKSLNIRKVLYFYKVELVYPTITFHLIDSSHVEWTFKDKEERDIFFNKILSLQESININSI